ncbi:universal stress protein [Marimonas lutisalis]|uniref:universal stress protein n=1 Tax=Marimonas lutisalis TaxID=2545756 RepID=UPI0010F7E1C2|nr:universal stress protein [Marimonas lutisalis]
MQRILVATDLSERSDRALHRAAQIAKAHAASLSVVSVVDDDYPSRIIEDLTERVRQHLEQIVPAADLACEIHVEAGDPTETLLRHINGNSVDLAVLGLHRHRAVLDGVRQTTMERLVAGARVPVLLAKGLQSTNYQKVLAPVSFSPACASALRVARVIAPEAEYELCHAWHVPFSGFTGGAESDFGKQIHREIVGEAKAWHAALDLDVPQPDLILGGVGEVLAIRLREFSPDLITIGAHTRAGRALHRLGGFAAELIRDPPTDLLIARA